MMHTRGARWDLSASLGSDRCVCRTQESDIYSDSEFLDAGVVTTAAHCLSASGWAGLGGSWKQWGHRWSGWGRVRGGRERQVWLAWRRGPRDYRAAEADMGGDKGPTVKALEPIHHQRSCSCCCWRVFLSTWHVVCLLLSSPPPQPPQPPIEQRPRWRSRSYAQDIVRQTPTEGDIIIRIISSEIDISIVSLVQQKLSLSLSLACNPHTTISPTPIPWALRQAFKVHHRARVSRSTPMMAAHRHRPPTHATTCWPYVLLLLLQTISSSRSLNPEPACRSLGVGVGVGVYSSYGEVTME